MQGTWENGKYILASTKDERIAKLETENQRLREHQQWISVDDRLPELHRPVLTISTNGHFVIKHVFRKLGIPNQGELVWSGSPPTHWMPLPEPPEVSDGLG